MQIYQKLWWKSIIFAWINKNFQDEDYHNQRWWLWGQRITFFGGDFDSKTKIYVIGESNKLSESFEKFNKTKINIWFDYGYVDDYEMIALNTNDLHREERLLSSTILFDKSGITTINKERIRDKLIKNDKKICNDII